MGHISPAISEGDKVTPGTMIETQEGALLIIQSSWSSDSDEGGSTTCWVIISGRQSYRVQSLGPGECKPNARGDEIQRAQNGEQFIAKASFYSSPKGDAPTPTLMSAAERLRAELPIKGSGPEVFLVVAGKRRWIPDEITFDALGLDWQAIRTVSDQRLNGIPRGEDYPSLPGKLLKGSSTEVFLLERGKRRWIPDEATFNAMGLDWQAVRVISDELLNSIPRGPDYPPRR
jgi:hypothetical protein